jgi:hypothetical protein
VVAAGLPDIFRPKITIWVNFGGYYVEWKMLVYLIEIWNILLPSGVFYGHLVMLCLFGKCSPVLVNRVKKNLATLVCRRSDGASVIKFVFSCYRTSSPTFDAMLYAVDTFPIPRSHSTGQADNAIKVAFQLATELFVVKIML